ncbi:hypothetical protein ADL12_08245 [Streptomyces regalis]|uniref:Uncharacterized protein n=1 Tax=Streptomyces regalis TaxID=68262 RepID=A0A0X3VEL3_9ACTN|nr:hypothetical protein ADL12_08245 [Streptomyces regalis]
MFSTADEDLRKRPGPLSIPHLVARTSKAGVARPRRVRRHVAPGEAVPLHLEAVAFAGHYDFDIDVRRSPRTGWRVYSYDALGSFVAIPLAQATVGPLSAAIGVHTTLLGAAVVILGCTVAMLAVRDVRALRIRTASPATGLVSAPVSAAA